MQLVDEEQDLALALADFLQHGLQPLLKFAPVLGAGDERAHVQGEDGLVLQAFGHIAADDPLGQALGDGGLAHAGLTDEHRVVLGLAGEDADDVSDLVIPADHRVQLVLPCPFHQIGAVFAQGVIGALRVIPGDRRALHLAQLRGEGVFGDAVVREDPLDGGGGRGEDADHQVLHGGVFVPHGLGRLLGGVQGPVCVGGEVDGIYIAHLRQLADGAVQLAKEPVHVHAHFPQQGGDQTPVLVRQGVEQMLGRNVVVVILLGHGLGGLHGLQRLSGIVLSVHRNTPLNTIVGAGLAPPVFFLHA